MDNKNTEHVIATKIKKYKNIERKQKHRKSVKLHFGVSTNVPLPHMRTSCPHDMVGSRGVLAYDSSRAYRLQESSHGSWHSAFASIEIDQVLGLSGLILEWCSHFTPCCSCHELENGIAKKIMTAARSIKDIS